MPTIKCLFKLQVIRVLECYGRIRSNIPDFSKAQCSACLIWKYIEFSKVWWHIFGKAVGKDIADENVKGTFSHGGEFQNA